MVPVRYEEIKNEDEKNETTLREWFEILIYYFTPYSIRIFSIFFILFSSWFLRIFWNWGKIILEIFDLKF